VNQYFDKIQESVEGTLALFTEDAVIYEPFSCENGLRGRVEIGHFLKVARMANIGLRRKISVIKLAKNRIEVLVQFTRGGIVKSRCEFTIKDVETETGIEKRIKELRIQFLG
jgi:hypothetical protein